MSKSTENLKTTIMLNPKVDNVLRKHAFKNKFTLGEMIEIYQNAYLEKQEREKAEKKSKKEI